MKIKVSEATGPVLDWMVAKCEGIETRNNAAVRYIPFQAESDDELIFECMADDASHAIEQCENAYPECTVGEVAHIAQFKPSSDWALGGPIIDQMILDGYIIQKAEFNTSVKVMRFKGGDIEYQFGPTVLVAGLRCYVASKLGDEVEVPDELV